MLRFIVIAVALLGSCPGMAANCVVSKHFTAQLLAESRTPAPGSQLTLALQIQPERGWHTYWKNPGETGFPPRAEWTLPAGFTAGELKFPLPTELVVDGFRSNVLEGNVILLTQLAIPATFPKGTLIPIGLNLNLAICSMGQCLPRKIKLDLSLVSGNGKPDTGQIALFKKARGALPSPVDGSIGYQLSDKTFELLSPLPAADDIVSANVFFEGEGIVAGGDQRLENKDGKIAIAMPRGNIHIGAALSGVIRIVHSGQANEHNVIRGYRFVAQPAVASP